MDEEYAKKKELMDWIVAGMAGRHYPKPAEAKQDKTAAPLIAPKPVDRTPVADIVSFVAPLSMHQYQKHGFGSPFKLGLAAAGDVAMNAVSPIKMLGYGAKAVNAVRAAKAVNAGAMGSSRLGLAKNALVGAGDNIAYTGIEDLSSDQKLGLSSYALSGVLGAGFGAGLGMAGRGRKPFDDKSDFSAWHGSPHSFDKFSLDHIGTGEGAQAYGHGLYFTDKKGIAKAYASMRRGDKLDTFIDGKQITEKNLKTADGRLNNALNLNDGDLEKTKQFLISNIEYSNKNYKKLLETFSDSDLKKLIESEINALELLNTKKITSSPVVKKLGQIYNVKIHGDKPVSKLNFMRWDKPMTEDNKFALWKEAQKSDFKRHADYLDDLLYNKNLTGDEFYEILTNELGSDKAVSEFMRRAGIDGIQYPSDFQTKGTHEKAFNYVVFDDNAIDIAGKEDIIGIGARSNDSNADLAGKAIKMAGNYKDHAASAPVQAPDSEIEIDEVQVKPADDRSLHIKAADRVASSSSAGNSLESAKRLGKSLEVLKSIFSKNPFINPSIVHAPGLPDMQRKLDSLNAVYPNPSGKNRFSPIEDERLD